MKLHTASEVISFIRKREEQLATFYKELSRKFIQDKDVFLSFEKENKKNIIQIERAYYGVISDALEGCFSFTVDTDDYSFDTELPEKAGYSEALDRAVDLEDNIIKFYSDAAEQSKSYMADIPRALMLVAKKKRERILKLKEMISEEQIDD